VQTLIRIIRDRDQTVLEQDVADLADGTTIGRKVSDLLARIREAHPQADLTNLTIKIGDYAPAAGA
jgi:hypothetical protein